MFNYREEKYKFDLEWSKLRKQYRAAKMAEEDIEQLYLFDFAWFRSRRRYESRALPLDLDNANPKQKKQLLKNYYLLSVSFDESDFSGRYDWLEEIDSQDLSDRLKMLSDDYLELLTLLVEDEYIPAEIARLNQCSRNAISKKISKIKKFF